MHITAWELIIHKLVTTLQNYVIFLTILSLGMDLMPSITEARVILTKSPILQLPSTMPLNTDTKTKETVWCYYSVGEVSSLPRLHIRLSEWTVSVEAHLLFIATPKMDGGTK